MTGHAKAKRTNGNEVYGALREDILVCRLAPGSKLRINDFCERFDVSLGAVREALSRLTSDALVRYEPQRGYFVAAISRSELLDLTRTRIDIESLCLRNAIRNATVMWEGEIVGKYHALMRLQEVENLDQPSLSDAWSSAHRAFHEALVANCDSPTLMRIRRMLFEQTERYRRLSVPVRDAWRDVDTEHRKILDATLNRNADAACMAMAAHLNKTTEILLHSSFMRTGNAEED